MNFLRDREITGFNPTCRRVPSLHLMMGDKIGFNYHAGQEAQKWLLRFRAKFHHRRYDGTHYRLLA